ncbi:acyltransferase [uncultured Kriegella sp.]|uniref:acyltransferase n=1 Tax=uncultured Kriegella sp. TaxID=1798910 RepID=UPI0030D729DC|tara:strand:- start:15753 stop:16814 length:1062 start_codon:yes stop_codon:yes gene_type:complete
MKNFNRIDYLDYVRGGATFLVLLHHSGVLQAHILAFHMPIFFVLSGYLLNLKEGKLEKFSVYFKKRFNRLIVPYLLFEFLNLFVAVVFHNVFKTMGLENVYHVEIGYAIRDILLCIESSHYIGVTNLFWFLPCLFVADLFIWFIDYFFYKLFRDRTIYGLLYFIVFILFVTLSYLENKYIDIRMPFTLDTSLMATAFIALGYSSRKLVDKFYFQNAYYQICYIVVGLVGVLFSVKMNSGLFLMFINEYGNYFYALLGATSGILFFINLIFLSEKILPKQALIFLSINSLIFYPIHLDILAFISKVFSYINLSGIDWSLPYLKVAITMLLIIPCIYIFNMYLPVFSGKKKVLNY